MDLHVFHGRKAYVFKLAWLVLLSSISSSAAKDYIQSYRYNQTHQDFSQPHQNFNHSYQDFNQSYRHNQSFQDFNQSYQEFNQSYQNYNQSYRDNQTYRYEQHYKHSYQYKHQYQYQYTYPIQHNISRYPPSGSSDALTIPPVPHLIREPITDDVTYAELRQLGGDCHPRSTCNTTRSSDDITKSFCHCGQFCRQLDTCCLDSEFRHAPLNLDETPHKCVAEYQNAAIRYFLVDRCNSGWAGEAFIRELCVGDAELLSDPLLLIPVTNARRLRSYKNIYCAVCNGEQKADVTFWNLRAYISGNRQMSIQELKRLRFNFESQLAANEWEVPSPKWVVAENGVDNAVDLLLDVPPELSGVVKLCRNMVSTCADGWTDDVVRQKCASYMAHVLVNGPPSTTRYRNVHCAICNFRDLGQMQCAVINPADPGERGKRPFSFGRLLDISPTGGDVVGVKQRCKETELFHPVKQECVPLAGCFIGHVFRDGVCVRRRD